MRNFYNLIDGGDAGTGHLSNPSTGLPYTPQIVPRADYTRVLAEFWADGPDSETPPGHWFELLNYVNDHSSFEKKWRDQGDILDDLEWDVKAYFTMGGAVHDAAVTAWGIKGWYDYIRPVSAIRYMADKGQSSDITLPSYSKDGIPLLDGYIQLVIPSDTLQGFNANDTGKIKVLAWRGPDYIVDPVNDVAGVGWILAEDWWPYQRPTFITPPFAGYVSGHSTFSRAAAEVMTAMTGDEFFPGGMGEFSAVKDSFLVFEDGPSVDITLQWATYRDASDQCSLSRIWGGIHPPVDDIPGRLIGEKIGVRAFGFAEKYMDAKPPSIVSLSASVDTISLINVGTSTFVLTSVFDEVMDTLISPTFTFPNEDPLNTIVLSMSASSWLNDTTFLTIYDVNNSSELVKNIDIEVNGASDRIGNPQILFQTLDLFSIDTKSPNVLQLSASVDTISLIDVGVSTFVLTSVFDEIMDTLISPTFTFPNEDPLNTIALNISASSWLNDSTFLATYNVTNSSELVTNINVEVNGALDRIANPQILFQALDIFNIDTKSPSVIQLSASVDTISLIDVGVSTFVLTAVFDEVMDTLISPIFTFPNEDPLNTIALNISASGWLNDSTFLATYNVTNSSELVTNINVEVNSASDHIGNSQLLFQESDLFNIDTKSPNVMQLSASVDTISLIDVGLSTFVLTAVFDEAMDTLIFPTLTFPNESPLSTLILNMPTSSWLNDTTFLTTYDVNNSSELVENVNVEVNGGLDRIGNPQLLFQESDLFNIDTKSPSVLQLYINTNTVTLGDTGIANFSVTVIYDERMNNSSVPAISFPIEDPLLNTLVLNLDSSIWQDDSTYISWFDVSATPESMLNIDIQVDNAKDRIGNLQNSITSANLFNIHTKQPELLTIIPSVDTISYSDTGVSTFFLALYFDEIMDTTGSPSITFPKENPLSNTLTLNNSSSLWTNLTSYVAVYDVLPGVDTLYQIDVNVTSVTDLGGNNILANNQSNVFHIDKKEESIPIPIGNSQYFGITVYPNPILADGNFSIAFEKNMQTLTAIITNVTGKIIQSKTYNDSQLLNLKLEEPAGVYILIIKSEDKKAVIKLVKK